MDEPKPVWTTASFLVYVGGLTVLGAALGALGYIAANSGKAAFAGWSLLTSRSSTRSRTSSGGADAGSRRASSRTRP